MSEQYWPAGCNHRDDTWNKYTIEAPTHAVAARLAADLNLWLHSWDWAEGDNLSLRYTDV